MGLEQQTILVTGATGGIGLAICEQLLQHGHRVVLTGRSAEKIDTARDALNTDAGQLETALLDICDADSARQAVNDALQNFGRLEGLVNCAGIGDIAPIVLGKPDNWRAVLETNVLGAFIITQAVLRPMLSARYGRIVHIGSISAELGAPYSAIYAASKAAIGGLVRSVALEVAATGITVNGVQPGYVKTPLFEQTQGKRAKLKGITLEQHEQDLIADTPTRKLVTPADVASLTTYLLSEQAASITGQLLNVDGGRTAR